MILGRSTLVRIEPPDRAVTPAINHVHPPTARVLKHHHWRASQIEFGDSQGDRKGSKAPEPSATTTGLKRRRLVLLVRRLDK